MCESFKKNQVRRKKRIDITQSTFMKHKSKENQGGNRED
jgi:hypothetical protein